MNKVNGDVKIDLRLLAKNIFVYMIRRINSFLLIIYICLIFNSCNQGDGRIIAAPIESLSKEQVWNIRDEFITVGKENCNFSSIKEALKHIIAVKNIVYVMDKIHTEGGIIIDKKAEIRGFGPAKTIIQAGNGPGMALARVFFVEKSGDVVLKGLTIRYGNVVAKPKRGAGIMNYGSLLVENCTITENSSIYGVGVWNEGELIMQDSTISHNVTVPPNMEEFLDASGCTGSGAGIKTEKDGNLKLINCTLNHNTSKRARGGGLFISCEARAELINCTIL